MRPPKYPIPPRYVTFPLYSVSTLMSSNERLRAELKQMQSIANQERNVRMQLVKEKQTLSGEKESLMRDKDLLS